jgi:hypothetical protein
LLQHAIGNEALIDAAEGIYESLQNALGLHYDLRKLLQGTPTAELLFWKSQLLDRSELCPGEYGVATTAAAAQEKKAVPRKID